MPGHLVMLAPVGPLLAGAICLAWSTTVTGRSHRRRLIATEALWGIAGLLALSNVAITIVHLCTMPLSRLSVGDSVAALLTGSMVLLAAVSLLGYVGLWAHVRRRRPAWAVIDERGSGGEWAQGVDELPAPRTDFAYPASIDPLYVLDDHERDSRKS